MKTITLTLAITLLLLSSFIQQPEPWTKQQIMPTKELAEKIQNNAKDLPLFLMLVRWKTLKLLLKPAIPTKMRA